jgi:hypothetical protein
MDPELIGRIRDWEGISQYNAGGGGWGRKSVDLGRKSSEWGTRSGEMSRKSVDMSKSTILGVARGSGVTDRVPA